MKILYVTDLHGDIFKYNKIFQLAKNHVVDCVINGGDMLPHDLFKQEDFIKGFLKNYFQKLEGRKIKYFCLLGNDDISVLDDMFDDLCTSFKYIYNIAQRKVSMEDLNIIGMNWVADYPFRLKDRCRKDYKEAISPPQFGSALMSKSLNPLNFKTIDAWFGYLHNLPTIEQELLKLLKPDNQDKTIYVMHMPPANVGLDVCYREECVGSKSIFNFISDNQPFLTLHGHIHESPIVSNRWFSSIGKTKCIQPGQSNVNDYVSYVILDTESLNTAMLY